MAVKADLALVCLFSRPVSPVVLNTLPDSPDMCAVKVTLWELTVLHFHDFCATVCKTVRPMLSVRCLSVTLVYCGQTVEWIKTKHGIEVGLGHTVLDGDSAPPLQRGTDPRPIFGPYMLWPTSWLDQDATWHATTAELLYDINNSQGSTVWWDI